MEFVVSGGHPALSPDWQCRRVDMRAHGRPRTICVCVCLYTQEALPGSLLGLHPHFLAAVSGMGVSVSHWPTCPYSSVSPLGGGIRRQRYDADSLAREALLCWCVLVL